MIKMMDIYHNFMEHKILRTIHISTYSTKPVVKKKSYLCKNITILTLLCCMICLIYYSFQYDLAFNLSKLLLYYILIFVGILITVCCCLC